jgi:hypothetical protein
VPHNWRSAQGVSPVADAMDFGNYCFDREADIFGWNYAVLRLSNIFCNPGELQLKFPYLADETSGGNNT